ncbi:MAG: urease accessory protein UreE [Pelistega sp.]|nr:urease accessory protein UreE [Pelistega sp.]
MSQIPAVLEHIYGNVDVLKQSGQITEQTIDYVSLQWFESERNILRKVSQGGRELALRLLKEGQRLEHHDVVFMNDTLVVAIDIIPSEVIVLSPKTLPEMARACYEIGNKHSPLFLDGEEVLLPYDAPMFDWLVAAGFAPSKEIRRLSKALRANSAQGGHAHHHGHHHNHHHSHGHHHHHGADA